MKTDANPRQSNPLPRRRRPWFAYLLVIVSVVVVGYTAGTYRSQSANPALSASPATATTATAGQAVAGRQTATASPTTRAPAKPHVLGTLVTKNMGSEQNPDRVYLAAGQAGTHPRFYARPGERVEIRVNNKDSVIHSLTLDPAEVNLDAWAGKLSITEPFQAPTKPGTYQFYCRYRKAGMSGTLVVRGQPVRSG